MNQLAFVLLILAAIVYVGAESCSNSR